MVNNSDRKTTRTVMRHLTECWQKARTISPGHYVKPLTDKERGQLKYLQKCLGGEAADVAEYALKNWYRFALRAGAEAGVTFPEEPHIGFFVKHHAVAVNMRRQTSAPLPRPEPSASSLALPQTPIELPHRLTAEELAEMLANLKAP